MCEYLTRTKGRTAGFRSLLVNDIAISCPGVRHVGGSLCTGYWFHTLCQGLKAAEMMLSRLS